jgi:NOL1/NOP2/fmu family ribosome biogenesis protein
VTNHDDAGDDHDSAATDRLAANDGSRFDRLPATAADRRVEGRASRREVLDWFDERFGVDPATFEGHTLWEKGAGKVWALAGTAPSPVAVEALGMTLLRTRQEHWKPTTDGVQRFCRGATRNVLVLDDERARRFLAGEDQAIEWDGDWGYLVVAREAVDAVEPLGVGLFTYGTLRSQVPKGRRRESVE